MKYTLVSLRVYMGDGLPLGSQETKTSLVILSQLVLWFGVRNEENDVFHSFMVSGINQDILAVLA